MSKIALSSNPLGTGTLTIASPNTNTDRTLTLPDNTGTVLTTGSGGIPVNGPAFSVYWTGSSGVTTNTEFKATLNVEYFDTANAFNTSTFTFQPATAGYYQLSYGIVGNASGTSLQTVNVLLRKNGAEPVGAYTLSSWLYPVAATQGASTGSYLVYMNGTTDTIELYAKLIGTSPIVIAAWMTGFLARSAT